MFSEWGTALLRNLQLGRENFFLICVARHSVDLFRKYFFAENFGDAFYFLHETNSSEIGRKCETPIERSKVKLRILKVKINLIQHKPSLFFMCGNMYRA